MVFCFWFLLLLQIQTEPNIWSMTMLGWWFVKWCLLKKQKVHKISSFCFFAFLRMFATWSYDEWEEKWWLWSRLRWMMIIIEWETKQWMIHPFIQPSVHLFIQPFIHPNSAKETSPFLRCPFVTFLVHWENSFFSIRNNFSHLNCWLFCLYINISTHFIPVRWLILLTINNLKYLNIDTYLCPVCVFRLKISKRNG